MNLLALWLLGAELEPPRFAEAAWDPGDRVTSTLDGEVRRDDARPASGDGVYGRFDGDLDLGFAAGAELEDDGARGAGRLSLHSFWMAGVTVAFAHGSGDEVDHDVLSLGVDLRPAFVPRWSQNMQRGPELLDLLVDSISVGTAVFWARPPEGDFGDRRGFELSLGFGVPLFGRADGLWLEGRGLLRWSDSGGSAEPLGVVLISWHTLFMSPWSRAVVE